MVVQRWHFRSTNRYYAKPGGSYVIQSDVMLLADRGFANHELISWLQQSYWHYCLRLPSDVLLHGPRRYPTQVAQLWPHLGEATFYKVVRRGKQPDRRHTAAMLACGRMDTIALILVLATPNGVKEPWAVITDEAPTLQTFWQYALRFRVEELFQG